MCDGVIVVVLVAGRLLALEVSLLEAALGRLLLPLGDLFGDPLSNQLLCVRVSVGINDGGFSDPAGLFSLPLALCLCQPPSEDLVQFLLGEGLGGRFGYLRRFSLGDLRGRDLRNRQRGRVRCGDSVWSFAHCQILAAETR